MTRLSFTAFASGDRPRGPRYPGVRAVRYSRGEPWVTDEEWWATAVRVSDDALELGDDLVMRWQGKPFTGISVEEGGPAPRSEVSYVNGIQEGESRDWHPNGTLSVSAFYRNGILHGVMTRYTPSGDTFEISSYEHGRRVSGIDGDETG